jgi:plastocyanin
VRPGGLVLALFVLAAGAGAHAVTAPPAIVSVTIDQVAFKESSVGAHVRDTIDWTNRDVIDHTATAKKTPGVFSAKVDTENTAGVFFGVEIPAGKKARVVLKAAGVIEYYCRYHPNMVGKIVVTAARQLQRLSRGCSVSCERDFEQRARSVARDREGARRDATPS